MKTPCISFMVTFGVALAAAQQPTATPTPSPTPRKSPASLRGEIIFKPIGMGAPAGRVDAGSRGDGDEVASLYVIAPDSVGLTADEQPTLFWFQTGPAAIPFEISVLRPNQAEPVLHVKKSGATTGGFRRLRLADHGVRLQPGENYQWVVALVRDPASRSRDIVSSGWVQYAPKLKAARGGNAVSMAAAGLWYDTVSAVFAQIDARPNDAQLAANRRDLFVQVGLPPLPEITAAKRR